MPPRIRPATSADYPIFERLFPELAVPDAVPDAATFEREIVPTALIADDGAGYVHYAILQGNSYVRHLVTAPEARRQGIGRALLDAVATTARAAGSTTWSLNVKPDNASAIALYEAIGMKRTYATRAVGVKWESVVVDAKDAANVVAREILPEDDARVTTAMKIMPGLLARSRDLGKRLVLLEAPGIVVGAAVFDPKFPGAYPFRVARPELSFVLLAALQEYREHDWTAVVCEDAPDVAAYLEARGAWLKIESVHMEGPL